MARIQAHAEPPPPPAASISAASSSNDRPRVPPAPAVFSRCSGQPSVSDSASPITSPARLIALRHVALLGRTGMQHHAGRADALADPQRLDQGVRDFLARISRSSEAQLIRYTAWIRTALIRVV